MGAHRALDEGHLSLHAEIRMVGPRNADGTRGTERGRVGIGGCDRGQSM